MCTSAIEFGREWEWDKRSKKEKECKENLRMRKKDRELER